MLEFFDELYKAVTNDELCFPFETKEIIWGWMTITVNLSKFSEYAKPCPEGRILE
ncbi:MAG: hypothetical protein IJS00_06970 [Paludibacteraceae bacterium]|nr:hypothetical protein [Paludibacteraceae bacterium]